jgi:hypothetical protein
MGSVQVWPPHPGQEPVRHHQVRVKRTFTTTLRRSISHLMNIDGTLKERIVWLLYIVFWFYFSAFFFIWLYHIHKDRSIVSIPIIVSSNCNFVPKITLAPDRSRPPMSKVSEFAFDSSMPKKKNHP